MKLEIRLTGKLLEDGIIASEDAKTVQYGLENMGNNLLGLFITLCIGCCFGRPAESLMLWLLVFPLRKNAGGFHAKTKGGCFFLSAALLLTAFIFLIRIEWPRTVYAATALLFFIMIFILAPVGNQNKRLDASEQEVYRRRTRIILGLEGLLFVLALVKEWNVLLSLITASFFLTGISLLAGRIKLLSHHL